MGFFDHVQRTGGPAKLYGVPVDFLHRTQCQSCSLNKIGGNKHPHMEPTGTDKPLVYMLGEAPGQTEDREDDHFIGESGQLLRSHIPKQWFPDLRWNNCVRTRPPDNRDPTPVEIECCRPSIVRDIERTKPQAIFGFGNIPLEWATWMTGIKKWSGRMVPVKIGSHACWFFPMIHPAAILNHPNPRVGEELEFLLNLDLNRAFGMVGRGLPEPVVHTAQQVLADTEIVTGDGGDADIKRITDFMAEMAKLDECGIDYETVGLRPYAIRARILTMALSDGAQTMAFAVSHPQAKWTEDQRHRVIDMIGDFLYEAPCRKIAHHLAFELEWSCHWFGRDVAWKAEWGDTATQAFVLDERVKMGKPDGLSLELLTVNHFGINVKALNRGRFDMDRLDEADLETLLRYNAPDAKYAALLHPFQNELLHEEGLSHAYDRMLLRVPAAVLTSIKGIPVDQVVVEKFYKAFTEELAEIEEDIATDPDAKVFRRKIGHDFQPSNNNDVKALCHKILNAFVDDVKEETLDEIDAPIIKLIVKHRGIAKLRSTYVGPLRADDPESMLFPDGLLHPILTTIETRTTRTSAKEVNNQNFPKRERREIRSQIRDPRKGYKVVSFDYGAIQVRNVAMESEDKALVKYLWDRHDMHADWMRNVQSIYPKWAPREEIKDGHPRRKYWRDRAKNEFVFPSFFGASGRSVAGYLGIPEDAGYELSDEFWKVFYGVKDWHERVKTSYNEIGYVEALSGFRRRAPISPNQLINAPIQADEAEIVMDAMIRLSQLGEEILQPNMEIHDDLTFMWHEDDIDELAPVVVEHMLFPSFDWAKAVPILVEMSVGDDWATTHGCGEYESDRWNGDLGDWRGRLAKAKETKGK